MAPKKKKAKATANTARGFATTSQPSKARVIESSDGHETSAITSTAGNASVAKQAGDSATSNAGPGEPTIQQMTPEELEKHLEDAELQDFLDRNGSRCRAESTRQVSRLKSERRQLRPQSHRLHAEDWLGDEVIEHIIAREISEDLSSNMPVKQPPVSHDEKMLADLWVLRRILDGLGLPRTDEAIAHIVGLSLRRQLIQNNYIPFGLTEALDWYAIHCSQSELPDYEDQDTTRPSTPDSDRHEDATDPVPANLAKVSGSVTTQPAPLHVEDADATDPQSSESSQSDAEYDNDDPVQMNKRWLNLQQRLWLRHNPAGDSKRPNFAKTRRLEEKISAIERDILFDKDDAAALWKPVQIELQRQTAKTRKKTIASRPQSNGDDLKAKRNASHSGDENAEDEEDGVFAGMFGAEEDAATEQSSSCEHNVRIVDLGAYTGLSPHQLLKQTCEKIDPKVKIKHTVLHQTSYAVRNSLTITWLKAHTPGLYAIESLVEGVSTSMGRLNWIIGMDQIAASTTTSSLDYVSILALFLVLSMSGQDPQSSRRLPSVWAHMMADLFQQQKKLGEAADKAILLDLRKIVQNAEESSNARGTQPPSRDRSTYPLASRVRKDKEHRIASQLSGEEALAAWNSRATGHAYQKMLITRQQLPIYQHKELILHTIANNPISIICAETGSGKSTQAGSYILEQHLSQGRDCHILVTQPRRISAISLARRISQELGEGKNDLGTMRSLVGYAIRLESKTSEMTRLTFATTGVLLRMLESSPTLDQLDYLILDEVHERTMEMDLAFIALRSLQCLRPSLKIILMSATVNASQFSTYFGNAPVLDIEGRTFPVTIKYLEDAIEATNDVGQLTKTVIDDPEGVSSDSEPHEASNDTKSLTGYSKATLRRLAATNEFRIDFDLIVRLATAIANSAEFATFSRAILIFMPGLGEIRRLHSALLGTNTFSSHWDLHMLHSSFTTADLELAFAAPAPGYRKIVIATNIAETGITIPDITAVIDTCKEKIMRFDERRQLSRLTEGFVARSSASQRRGRAARVQAGLCFHLVTRHRFDNLMLPQQVPEMLRLSLQDSIMRIKLWDNSASISETLDAALDPPPRKNVTRAIERLKDAGALTSTERLSSLGQLVARLPLDVSLAKLAVLATIFTCLDPALTIIALMTSKSIFLNPSPTNSSTNTNPTPNPNTLTGRPAFSRGGSDLLTNLAAHTAFQRARLANQSTAFARRHGLNTRALADVDDARVQLLVYLVDGGLLRLSAEERGALNRARSGRGTSDAGGGSAAYKVPQRYDRPASDDLLLSLIAAAFHPRLLVREAPSTGGGSGAKGKKGPRGLAYRNPLTNQILSLARGSVVHGMSRPPTWASYVEAMQMRAGAGVVVQEVSRVPEVGVGVFLGLGVGGGGGDGGLGGSGGSVGSGWQEDTSMSVFSGVLGLEGGKVRVCVRRWRQAVAVKVLRRGVRDGVERKIRALAAGRGRDVEQGGELGETETGGEWAIELLRKIGLENDGVGGAGRV